MRRHILRTLATSLPVLGLTTVASDGVAEGVDRFAWPLNGAISTGAGYDHNRTKCPSSDPNDDDGPCDETVDKSTYMSNRSCKQTKVYDQHSGADLYAPANDLDVLAAASGYVVSTIDEFGRGPEWVGHGFGNSVVVYHGGNLGTLYGHMLKDTVVPTVGEWVDCGDHLGDEGSSGNSDGDHLHFDVSSGMTVSSASLGGYFSGSRIDPYLSDKNDDDAFCGAEVSLWSGGNPGGACDADDYIGNDCNSRRLGRDVEDGTCVQDDACAWFRCIDGAWLPLPAEAVALACTPTTEPKETYANGDNAACTRPACSELTDAETCNGWIDTCGWSCETEACVDIEEISGEACMTMPEGACDDGELNGEETEIDCGGSECLSCDGGPCQEPAQCASDICEQGTCGPGGFDCHVFDADPDSCGNATGCIYHECADACSPVSQTACDLGCEDQCGVFGCVTATLSYFSSNNCISGPASGIAQLYRIGAMGVQTPAGMVGFNADGSFCADLDVGEQYALRQDGLPGFDCFDDYYVSCYLSLSVDEAGVDGVCADSATCEDLGALQFDCGS